MYAIKHVPEDFVVNEVSTIKPTDTGKFLYFRMHKRNYDTLTALKRVGDALHLPSSSLSCAGIKDKRAVTEQVCSIRGRAKQALDRLDLKDIAVEFLGYGMEPVHVGNLEGNEFTIVVRNIEQKPEPKTKFRNLFGEQRFSKTNAEVGRCIVKRDFQKAAELIAEQNDKLREKMNMNSNDWVGALRQVPRKLLLIFVHAYQSLLWNRAALKTEKDVLPMVGFGTEDIDDITTKILEEESITPRDFIIREFPEVSVEGTERRVWVEVKDVKISELEDDEHFLGKKKVMLEFFLPKGCYATEFVRQLFG